MRKRLIRSISENIRIQAFKVSSTDKLKRGTYHVKRQAILLERNTAGRRSFLNLRKLSYAKKA